MSLSESMSALCEEIARSQNERSQSVMHIKEDVTKTREDAQRMMSNLHSERIKAAKEIMRFLQSEKAKQSKETNDLLMRFKQEHNEIRQAIFKASGIWRDFTKDRRESRAFNRAFPPVGKDEEHAVSEGRLGRRRPKK